MRRKRPQSILGAAGRIPVRYGALPARNALRGGWTNGEASGVREPADRDAVQPADRAPSRIGSRVPDDAHGCRLMPTWPVKTVGMNVGTAIREFPDFLSNSIGYENQSRERIHRLRLPSMIHP